MELMRHSASAKTPKEERGEIRDVRRRSEPNLRFVMLRERSV